jgi:hypothetical protein
MPGVNGIEATRRIIGAGLSSRVLGVDPAFKAARRVRSAAPGG